MSFLRKIFGDKPLADTIDSFDELIEKIPPRVDLPNKSDQVGKLIGDIFSTSKNEDSTSSFSDTIEHLFQSVSVNQSRLNRYKTYDEIIRTVPLIKSILGVYKANMVNKNATDYKCFIFLENSDLPSKESNKDKIEVAREIQRKVIKDYDLTRKIKDIVIPQQLRYGDYFVEVTDLSEETVNPAAINQQSSFILTESKINNIINSDMIDPILEYFADNYLLEKEDTKKQVNYIDNIVIKLHKPNNIIILQTKYGTRLGYLEVYNNSNSILDRASSAFGNTISKVSSLATQSNLTTEDLTNKLVQFILKKVIKDNQSKFKNQNLDDINSLVKQLDPNIYLFIKKLFVEQGLTFSTSKFKKATVRFISVDSMVHFSNSSEDYQPYGESLIEHLILPGKLFMLSQLSNSINKMSRASLIRKWTLDVGQLQAHSRFGQQFKREMYNSKTTLDDLTSPKTISKFLTDEQPYKISCMYSHQVW